MEILAYILCGLTGLGVVVGLGLALFLPVYILLAIVREILRSFR